MTLRGEKRFLISLGSGGIAWERDSPNSPGGAEGNRTPDLVIANDALSHLSYGPVQVLVQGREFPRCGQARALA